MLSTLPIDERRQRFQSARDALHRLYSPACQLCEIRCGVDRAAGRHAPCGLAESTPVYRKLIHLGEERPLVPCYAVWLAGCNFLCSFCSDMHALRPPLPGRILSAETLADEIAADLRATRQPIRNIDFVGGDPSISLPYLADVALALLDRVPNLQPLLLNANGYLTPEALEASLDLFDIFLIDLKFGNDLCARKTGAPRRYTEVLHRNLTRWAATGRELWVRHLLMPEHLDCCTRPALGFLERLPSAYVNVMPGFVAFHEPWRSLRKAEIAAAQDLYAASEIKLKYWDGKPFQATSLRVGS